MSQEIDKKPASSGFVGHVLTLVSGSVLVQVIVLLASPIVSRIFPPEAFGEAALFMSIVSIISAVSCLSYDWSIMLPEKNEAAFNIFALCLLILVMISLLLTGVVFFAGSRLLTLINAENLTNSMWLLPPAVFIGGLLLVLRQWHTRLKVYTAITGANIAGSSVSTGSKIGLGLIGFNDGYSLIIFNILSSLVNILILCGRFLIKDIPRWLKNVSFEEITRLMRRYYKFPLFTSWSSLLNVSSLQVPVILLTSFYGATIVGYFSRSYLLLQVPVSLVGQAIAQVFFQRSSDKVARGEEISFLVENLYQRLVSLAMWPILIVAIVGPELFAFVFGKEWYEAGVYAQYLSPWLLLVFIVSPLSTLFNVKEKQGKGLLTNISLFSTRVFVLLLTGYAALDARWAVGLFSMVSFGINIFICSFLLHIAGVEMKKRLLYPARYFSYAAPGALILLYLKWFRELTFSYLVISLILYSLIYLYLIVKRDAELLKIIRRIFKRKI